jgi:hypothetical protein
MILFILIVFGYGFCFSESTLFSVTTFNLLFYSLAFQWTLILIHLIQFDFEISLSVVK